MRILAHRVLRPALRSRPALLLRCMSTPRIERPSYALRLATEKAAKMQRDLISDEDLTIKNFTLNFGPQARAHAAGSGGEGTGRKAQSSCRGAPARVASRLPGFRRPQSSSAARRHGRVRPARGRAAAVRAGTVDANHRPTLPRSTLRRTACCGSCSSLTASWLRAQTRTSGSSTAGQRSSSSELRRGAAGGAERRAGGEGGCSGSRAAWRRGGRFSRCSLGPLAAASAERARIGGPPTTGGAPPTQVQDLPAGASVL